MENETEHRHLIVCGVVRLFIVKKNGTQLWRINLEVSIVNCLCTKESNRLQERQRLRIFYVKNVVTWFR